MSDSFYLKLGEQDLGQKSREEITAGIQQGTIGSLHKISADGQVWAYATEHPAFGGSASSSTSDPTGDGPPPIPGQAPAPVGWFVRTDSEQFGPWSNSEVVDAIEQGLVQGQHLLRKTSTDDWGTVDDCFARHCKRVVRRKEKQERARIRAQKAIPPEAKSFSLVAGASLLSAFIVGPGSICAVVLGIVALIHIASGGGYIKGTAAAWGGILLGILPLAAFFLPRLL